MEASVGLSSPTKRPRRHYKAEYEKICAYADELVADLGEVKRNRDTHKELREWAEQECGRIAADLLTTNTSRYRWATAAVIEALALVIVAIVLFAR